MALISAFGPLPAQIAVLGAFISILGGLFLSYLEQNDQREEERAEALEPPSFQEVYVFALDEKKRPIPLEGSAFVTWRPASCGPSLSLFMGSLTTDTTGSSFP
jgi:hypothetical protein